MDVQLRLAEPAQLDILKHLMQLYLYDFDEFFSEGGVDNEGLFDPGFPLERYVDNQRFWAYLACVEDRLAGFTLISDRVEKGPEPGRYVEEFFVLRRYRRAGVGSTMAQQLFDLFPGYWEITILGENKPAQAFWRKVVNGYSQGQYQDFITQEQDETIVWLTFNSRSTSWKI